MIYNLKDPEDWYKIKDHLRLRCFEFPQFLHEFDKICKNIEIKIKDLAELNIQVKRNNTLWHQQVRDDKILEINQSIKNFSKILLVATLAKR